MRNAIPVAKSLWPLLVLALWVGPSYADSTPAAPSYPNMAPLAQYLSASPEAEIAAARSAAPPSISDKAEILVLDAHGYQTAVKGTNGFVCFVQRSWSKDFDDPEFWNPNAYMPQCWNAAAATSELPNYFKRTEWVLAGVSLAEMAARTKAAWASHEFSLPAPQSVIYMLSKEQYIADVPPGKWQHWYPHVMFHVPTTEDSTWGANGPDAQIFSTTSDVEPITTFFVIQPHWSDGTLGPYTPATKIPEAPHRHH